MSLPPKFENSLCSNMILQFILQVQQLASESERKVPKEKEEYFIHLSQKCFRPNKRPVVPISAQFYYNMCIPWHDIPSLFFPLGTWKKNDVMVKHYIRKLSPTMAHRVYGQHSLCHKYNPSKPLHGSQGHFPLPNGPFEVRIYPGAPPFKIANTS